MRAEGFPGKKSGPERQGSLKRIAAEKGLSEEEQGVIKEIARTEAETGYGTRKKEGPEVTVESLEADVQQIANPTEEALNDSVFLEGDGPETSETTRKEWYAQLKNLAEKFNEKGKLPPKA